MFALACVSVDSKKNLSTLNVDQFSLPWLAYVKLNSKTTLKLLLAEKVMRWHVWTCLRASAILFIGVSVQNINSTNMFKGWITMCDVHYISSPNS